MHGRAMQEERETREELELKEAIAKEAKKNVKKIYEIFNDVFARNV